MLHFSLAIFFVGIWLAPIAWVGFTDRSVPGAGRYLNYHWRIACLFPGRSRTWDNYFYEVRVSGSEEWREVPLDILGDMRPFGVGNRLHRMMAQGGGDRNRPAVLRSAALFVKERFEAENAGEPVTGIRFVRQRFPVGHPETAASGEPWEIPALSEVPESERFVWRQYEIEIDNDAK